MGENNPNGGQDPAGAAGSQGGAPAGAQNGGQGGAQGSGSAPAIDYDKLAQILEGRQAKNEDSVLKGYFKDLGLSKEQVEQAVTDFKAAQAAKQPNVETLQNQVTDAQNQARTAQQQALAAQINSAATIAAVDLGIETKTIPYVLKMADMTGVTDDKGVIDQEKLKAALNKVLEDVPGMKAQQPQQQQSGGFRFGAPEGGQGQQGAAQPQVATKKWNRFNH